MFITFPNSTLGVCKEIVVLRPSLFICKIFNILSQGKEKPWIKLDHIFFLQIYGFKSNGRTKIGPSLVKIKSSTPKPHYFSEVLSFCLWQEITFFEKNAFEDRKCDVKGDM